MLFSLIIHVALTCLTSHVDCLAQTLTKNPDHNLKIMLLKISHGPQSLSLSPWAVNHFEILSQAQDLIQGNSLNKKGKSKRWLATWGGLMLIKRSGERGQWCVCVCVCVCACPQLKRAADCSESLVLADDGYASEALMRDSWVDSVRPGHHACVHCPCAPLLTCPLLLHVCLHRWLGACHVLCFISPIFGFPVCMCVCVCCLSCLLF